MGRRIAWLVLLSACGPSESDFVVQYTDQYCTWVLECGSSAQLVFDGLDSVEECAAVEGPLVADRAESCKIDRAAAKHCLASMNTLPCPEEGALFEDSLPPECAAAWKKCLGEGAVEGDDTGDEP